MTIQPFLLLFLLYITFQRDLAEIQVSLCVIAPQVCPEIKQKKGICCKLFGSGTLVYFLNSCIACRAGCEQYMFKRQNTQDSLIECDFFINLNLNLTIIIEDKEQISEMRLKGQTIKNKKQQYCLKQLLGQGGFSTIFSTNNPDYICKVQVLNNPEVYKAYMKEKQMLLLLKHQNIVNLIDAFQFQDKNQKFGILILQNCNQGNAFNVLQKHEKVDVPQKLVLRIFYSVASALQFIHKNGVSHRDIKLQNVLKNSCGQYKLCDFGSCSTQIIKEINKNNRAQIQQYIQKTTTPLYRSPQQLDLYSGFQIGCKVDVFAMGVLAFMLCFKKQPFQSRLSSINKQYFIPEQTTYSSELIQLIQSCFTTNPKQRITAQQVKEQIKILLKKKKAQIQLNLSKQIQQTIEQLGKINKNLLKNDQTAQSGIFDKLKRIYNQITTQTEGWIAGFAQDNQQAPLLKYNRSIISKCWQKRYKVQKFYQIVWKYSQQYKAKSLVNIKLLILIHNFLRKGPPQSILYEKQYSSIKLCTKIYKNWKQSQRPTSSDDVKRNSYVCLLIRHYSLIIIQKSKICFENSDLIEANYSIVPFLRSNKQIALLKLPFIQSLLVFLKNCVDFHQIISKHSYLVQIQRSIILSLVDQQYCLLSLLVFLICAFKQAIPYIKEELDLQKLSFKLNFIQSQFQEVFFKLAKLFDNVQKLASLFQQENHFSIKTDVLKHIKSINIQHKKQGIFNINQHINYKKSIFGLKIPLTYEQAVKNPNFLKDLELKNMKNTVQINQYKVHNNSGSQKVIQTEKKQEVSSQAFLKNKNKENNIFMQQPFVKEGNGNISFQSSPNNIMQFTHQNLNKDMSQNITKQKEKTDQFKDFLSIVDQKYQKSKSSKVNFKQYESHVMSVTPLKQKKQTKVELGNFKSCSKQSSSQISPYVSKNSNLNERQIKNDFQTSNRNQKKKNIDKPEVKEEPKQIGLIQSENKQLKNRQNQIDSIYSSINNVSKDIYASLNKESAQKIQLINFFDDEEIKKNNEQQGTGTQEKMQTEVEKQKIFDSMNKTVPDSFGIKNDLISFDVDEIKKNNEPDQNKFKTMPSQNSFIDLKGFIVEQVKKNAEQYFIDYNSLKFYEKVGYGHSSQVFKGQWRGRQIAIKRIKDNITSANAQKQFKRQIMTSVRIRHHPNLVTLIGIAQYNKEYYIINQFCNGLTLFEVLHECSTYMSIKAKLFIAKQIAKGMIFLHTNDPPIIHRDLKSLNVLLVNKYNGEDQPQIKIADFGLSRDFASTYMTGTLGTYHWMAPQIFNNEPYSLKADVYSFGIVLWEILSRSPPYTNMKNPQSLMKFITLQNGRPDLGMIGNDCPIQLKMLMIRCWDKLPENRPNFIQVLATLNHITV